MNTVEMSPFGKMLAGVQISAKLLMGERQRHRAKLMEMVVQKKMLLTEASTRLNISYRQAKRIYRRYREGGDSALLHANQGRRSNRRLSQEFRQKVISTYRLKYHDFGPTFAAEKLAQCDGLKVSGETLRCWLLEEGLWEPKRRSTKHRSRRERKAQFGQLLQFDGSHHAWFENRGRKCCLMNIVDDASGISMSMLFEQETTEAIMILLGKWIKKYGIPQAVYCDCKNSFITNREASNEEILKGIKPMSHFEKAVKSWG